MGLFRFRKDDTTICEKAMEANQNTNRRLPRVQAKEQRVIDTARARGGQSSGRHHRESN